MHSMTRNPKARSGRKIGSMLLAGTLFGAIGAGTAGAASAKTPAAAADAPSVTVRYGDLDLTSAAGTRVLYRRLVGAAKQVCPDASGRELSARHSVEVCREQAIINAARQIPSPQLAAMVADRVKAG